MGNDNTIRYVRYRGKVTDLDTGEKIRLYLRETGLNRYLVEEFDEVSDEVPIKAYIEECVVNRKKGEFGHVSNTSLIYRTLKNYLYEEE